MSLSRQTIISFITPIIVILFLFIAVFLLINSKREINLKTLSLPEEFMQITKGDTLGIYESKDTIYIEFYRGDIRPNSNYKLIIAN